MLGALTASALIAWAGSVWVLRQPLALRLTGTLRLCGGYGPEGGRVIIERTIDAAAMGLCLAGVALAIGGLLDARVALDLDILSVPAIAAGFWCASAWRYHRVAYAYLMLAAVIFAVLVLIGAVGRDGRPPAARRRSRCRPRAGAGRVRVPRGRTGRGVQQDPAGRARTLYPVPLAYTAVALGW